MASSSGRWLEAARKWRDRRLRKRGRESYERLRRRHRLEQLELRVPPGSMLPIWPGSLLGLAGGRKENKEEAVPELLVLGARDSGSKFALPDVAISGSSGGSWEPLEDTLAFSRPTEQAPPAEAPPSPDASANVQTVEDVFPSFAPRDDSDFLFQPLDSWLVSDTGPSGGGGSTESLVGLDRSGASASGSLSVGAGIDSAQGGDGSATGGSPAVGSGLRGSPGASSSDADWAPGSDGLALPAVSGTTLANRAVEGSAKVEGTSSEQGTGDGQDHSAAEPGPDPHANGDPSQDHAPQQQTPNEAEAWLAAVKAQPNTPILRAVHQLGGPQAGQLFIQGAIDAEVPIGSEIRIDLFAAPVAVSSGGSATPDAFASTTVVKRGLGMITFKAVVDAELAADQTAVFARASGPFIGETDYSRPVEIQSPHDADADGVDGAVEDLAANSGDGNLDGIPDSQQADVASFPSAVTADFFTLDAKGRPLKRAGVSRSPDGLPDNIEMPFGLVGFEITEVEPGGSAAVELHVPGGARIDGYYKQDPVTKVLVPFDFDGTTGAVIDGNLVTLHFVDGGRGDLDGLANGVIVDPGGVVTIHVDQGDPVVVSGNDEDWILNKEVHGGTSQRQGNVEAVENASGGHDLVLTEGDSFLVTTEKAISIPSDATELVFKYEAVFDTANQFFINDAFEAALLDDAGNSVVATVRYGRDSFFNLTEEETAAELGVGTQHDDFLVQDGPEPGTVQANGTVVLTLPGALAGGTVTLVFRLVNDDMWGDDDGPHDTTTKVTILEQGNRPPTSDDNTVTTDEDTLYTFALGDFAFSDPDPGDTLQMVKITSLETVGSLELSGVEVTLDQEIVASEISAGNLTFVPEPDENGSPYDSFQFKVSDGTLLSVAAYTMTVNVTPIPDPPTSDDNTVTTDEDTTYTFLLGDFAFSDPDPGDTLQMVKITSLETVGSLKLSGADVTLNQEIAASEISAGNLTFVPEPDENGSPYDSFQFKVSDGTLLSVSAYTMTVNVTSVGDPPTSDDNTVTTDEDTTYTFLLGDFAFADPDPGDTLQMVKITGLETVGSLELSGADVTLNQEIAASEISAGNLKFVPEPDENGSPYDSFQFKVSDGTLLSVSAYTMTVNVTPIPDPPTSADNTVTTEEDTTYTFLLGDFAFADPDPGDTLQMVKITGLETAGSLELSGANVTLNQEIVASEISAGNLKFVPEPDENGSPYDSFRFKVSDGVLLSVSAYTMTVNVTPIPDPPTSADNTVTTDEDTTYTFLLGDFAFWDPDAGDTLQMVKITGLETVGSLKLSGAGVTLNQEITASEISAGNLTFVPEPDENGSPYDSFQFKVSDGTLLSVSAYTMTVNVTPIPDPPMSVDKTVTTLEDTTYTFALADFAFSDPDAGDGLQKVQITSLETAGSLKLFAMDVALNQEIAATEIVAGNLTFVPGPNENGSPYDSFQFKVSDGMLLSVSAYTMTVNVTSVNDEPAGTDNTVTTLEDTTYTFAGTDFGFTDPNDNPPNDFNRVKITTVPVPGTLKLDGVELSPGDFVALTEVDAGKLTFDPEANANGSPYTTFTFQVEDDGGTADGGVNLDQSPNTMTINVTPVDDLPEIQSVSIIGANEGGTVELEAVFTDPDDSSGHEAWIDWRDGYGLLQQGTIEAYGDGWKITASHLYADDRPDAEPDQYTVFVGVTDPHSSNPGDLELGNPNAQEAIAEVSNVQPSLTAGASFTATGTGEDAQMQVLVSGSFTDPGFTHDDVPDPYKTWETFDLKIDWGDGTPEEDVSVDVIQGGPGVPTRGTFSATYSYAEGGIYTVTVKLKDDDSDYVQKQFTYGVLTLLIDEVPTINLGANGRIPVKVLSGYGVDLTQIDVSTVRFGPAGAEVAQKPSGGYFWIEKGNGDVMSHFNTQECGFRPSDTVAFMTGRLSDVDRTPFVGMDTIRISASTDDDDEGQSGGNKKLPRGKDDDWYWIPPAGTLTTTDADGSEIGPSNDGVLVNDWDLQEDPLTAVLEEGPAHGTVTLNPDGTFTYHHDGSETTADSFTYRPFDGKYFGNVTTVTIQIENVPKYFVADAGTRVLYRYDTNRQETRHLPLDPAARDARGAVIHDDQPHDLTDARLWTLGAGHQVALQEVGGGFIGTWRAFDLDDPQGIATDGNDMWIVDRGNLQVHRYSGLAGHTGFFGVGLPSQSIDLYPGGDPEKGPANASPTGITTDGEKLWVVDDGSDRVYVYLTDGTCLGSWGLDGEGDGNDYTNTDPSGLTWSLTEANILWVVDRADKFVYRYAGVKNKVSGDEQAVGGSFSLGSEAVQPEGIADPQYNNTDPVAVDDEATANAYGGPVYIYVLNNDYDPDPGDTLTITDASDPEDGSVQIYHDAYGGDYLTYTPDPDFDGDSFTYTIDDGYGGTATATVTVNDAGGGGNQVPVAVDDQASTSIATGEINIYVLSNDYDPDPGDVLTITGVSQPTSGIAEIVDNPSGDDYVTYTPGTGFAGDSFTYTIEDGYGGTDTATVTVNDDGYGGSTDPPTAVDDEQWIAGYGGAVDIDVLVNDYDSYGGTLTITDVTTPSHGTAVISGGGTYITYTPASPLSNDSFQYTIEDPDENTATATVWVYTIPDYPPAAVDDTFYDPIEGVATHLYVLSNDYEPEGDTLTITDVSGASGGTVAIGGGGTHLVYTADAGFSGDNFTYTVSDSVGNTSTATVSLVTWSYDWEYYDDSYYDWYYDHTQEPGIESSATALELANAMAADPSMVVGANFVAVPPAGKPYGVGTTPVTGFGAGSGQSSYAILSSGEAALVDDPGQLSSFDLQGGNVRGDSDYDVTILRVDLNVPAGANYLSFDFQFFSEEFPVFAETVFNDAFIAELDSSTWTTSGGDITAPNNFAVYSGGDPVSVCGAGRLALSPAHAAGTAFDGTSGDGQGAATPVYRATKSITPGTHSLYLSVFDQGDRLQDSTVLVSNLRVGTAAGAVQDGVGPALQIEAYTAKDRVEAYTDVVIYGEVTTDEPLKSITITPVWVDEDGQPTPTGNSTLPVQVVDASNRFFTVVPALPGVNSFQLVATDLDGNSDSDLVTFRAVVSNADEIDYQILEDVSASILGEYGPTSFNEQPDRLFADVAIRNDGMYWIDAPLLVGVTNIRQRYAEDGTSGPLLPAFVCPEGIDGVTPDGIPYYDFTALVDPGAPADEKTLEPGEATGVQTISFYNPGREPFNYDLVVLGKLNEAPRFTTAPVVEAQVGHEYRYDFDAFDADGDSLQYDKLMGPSWLSIETEGDGNLVLEGMPPDTTPSPAGNHVVTLEVADGRGGFDTQTFVVTVHQSIPNRPPEFKTLPVTVAYVNMEYKYPAWAEDLDNDELEYSKDAGPDDLSIDSATGEVTWVPGPEDVDQTFDVVLRATESQTEDHLYDTQPYQILVLPQPGNHPPEIISEPITNFKIATELSPTGEVSPIQINLDLGNGEEATREVGARVPWWIVEDYCGLPPYADIVFVVDESGSMIGDHQWIKQAVQDLDRELEHTGIGNDGDPDASPSLNRYGLVGFGGATGGEHFRAHSHLVGGEEFGTDAELNAAIDTLVDNGGWEDGYDGIEFALDYTFREDAAVHLILITDEGREYYDPIGPETLVRPDLDFPTMLSSLDAKSAKLNVVVEADFSAGDPYFYPNYPPVAQGDQIHNVTAGTSVNLYVLNNDFDPGGDPLSITDNYTTPPGEAFSLNEDRTFFTFTPSAGFTYGSFEYEIEDSMGQTATASVELFSDPYGGYWPETPFAQNDKVWNVTDESEYDIYVLDNDWDCQQDPLTITGYSQPSHGELELLSDANGPYFRYTAGVSFEDDTFTYTITDSNSNPDTATVYLYDNPPGGWGHYTDGQVFGVDSEGTGYVDDGAGGYLAVPDGVVVDTLPQGWYKPPKEAYVDLAWAVSGGAWDIVHLTNPSSSAAFTSAFVDIKAAEISQQGTIDAQLTVLPAFAGLFANETGAVYDLQAREWATFPLAKFTGDGHAHTFELFFVRADANGDPTGVIFGSIPVAINASYRYDVDAIDPDKDKITYSLVEAPAGATIDPDTGVINWLPPEGGTPEDPIVYHFIARADDGRGGYDEQPFDVEVVTKEENVPPSITSAPPPKAAMGRTYVYQVEATDADDELLRYFLEAPSNPEILAEMSIDIDTGLLIWTPTIDTATVTVRVLDARGEEATQVIEIGPEGTPGVDVEVVASFVNTPPEFDPLWDPPGGAIVGQVYKFPSEPPVDDPDPDLLEFDLRLKPIGMGVDPATGIVVWTPTAEQVGDHDVLLRVRDGQGGVDLKWFTVTVAAANVAPVIISEPPDGPALADASGSYQFKYHVIAEDANDDDLDFAVDAPTAVGMQFDPSDPDVLIWSPTTAHVGTHTVTITVSDNFDGSDTQTFHLEVTADLGQNAEPRITSSPRLRVRGGQKYFYHLLADDDNGEKLTCQLIEKPSGMQFADSADPDLREWDEQAVIEWQTTVADIGSSFSVTVRVTDEVGAAVEQSFEIEVISADANTAPEIVSTPPAAATLGRLYKYDVKADDAEDDLITWSLIEGPVGMTLGRYSGALRWTPTADQLGLQEVLVQAEDVYGASDTQAFTIQTRAINLPPQIDSFPPTTAVAGQPYVYPVRAVDEEGDEIFFSGTVVQPDESTVDLTSYFDEDGVLVWTPSFYGEHQVTIEVYDDPEGLVNRQIYTLVVSYGMQPVYHPPVITSTPPFYAEVGIPCTYTVEVEDEDGDFTWVDNPPVVTITGPYSVPVVVANNVVTFTAPDEPTPYSFTVVVEVADDEGLKAWQEFTVQAMPLNNKPEILSTPPDEDPDTPTHDITSGLLFRYDVQVEDEYPGSLDYRLVDVPDGLDVEIDRYGRITWQSPLGLSEVQDYPAFGVIVTDVFGKESDRQDIDLRVLPDTTLPTVTLLVEPSPSALKGEEMTALVYALDNVGVESLTLTVEWTSLQQQTYSQEIVVDDSGVGRFTPTEGGTYRFKAKAIDAANNQRLTQHTDITVVEPDDSWPVVTLASPFNDDPANDHLVLTEPTAVSATVSDVNPVTYTLEVLGLDGHRAQLIDEVTTPAVVTNIDKTVDPTILPNGSYTLRLTVTDTDFPANRTTTVEKGFTVAGRLKLGNFNFSVTDLAVSVAGIPITVNRAYDTLKADQKGDFGFGWSLGYGDAQIEVEYPEGTLHEFGALTPFTVGTRVTFIAEDGTSEGFTFKVRQVDEWFWSTFHPYFEADAGVTSRLQVKDFTLYANPTGPGYVYYGQGITPYNPADPIFGGYKLIGADGIRRKLDPETGRLEEMTDRYGNSISFTPEAITSNRGRQLTITRDPQTGFITKISDPRGNSVHYVYDADGNLERVYDRLNDPADPDAKCTRYEYVVARTRPDGSNVYYVSKTFDPTGQENVMLTFNTDPGGDGRLGEIADPTGKLVEVEYTLDTTNHAYTQTVSVTRTDSSVETTIVTSDEYGNITRHEDAAGQVTEWEYVEVEGVKAYVRTQTQIVGEPGGDDDIITTYGISDTDFDPYGSPKTIIDPLGNQTYYRYNAAGQPTSITDPLGNTVEYGYEWAQEYAYDEYAEVSRLRYTVDPAGSTTVYEYDEYGNRVEEIRGAEFSNFMYWDFYYGDYYGGPYGDYQYHDPNDPDYDPNEDPAYHPLDRPELAKTSYSYNQFGDLESTTDPRGFTMSHGYDYNGNRTGTEYTWVNPDDPLDTDVVSTQTFYDYEDRLTTMVDAEGWSSLQEYDVQGRPYRFTNIFGESQTRLYDAAGNRIQVEYSDGTIERYVFDDLGRLVIAAYRYAPGEPGDGYRVTYDKAGRFVTKERLGGVVIDLVDDLSNPGAKKTEFVSAATVYATGQRTYDATGRLEVSTEPNGQVTRYEYDKLGRQTAVVCEDLSGHAFRTEYEYDAAGRRTKMIDALQRVTRYVYDDAGRLIRTIYADGTSTEVVYDTFGRIVEESTQAGQITKYEYNPVGDRTAVILPAVRDPEDNNEFKNPRIEYSYDQYGNLTGVTDAKGHQTEFTYDSCNRRLTRTLPTGEVEQSVYDGDGRLTERIDAKGQLTKFFYDEQERLSGKEFYGVGSTTPDDWVEYEYDVYDRVTQITQPRGTTQYAYNTEHQLTQAVSPEGVVYYQYDPMSRQLIRTCTGDPANPTSDILYGYDVFHRLETVTAVTQNGQAVPADLQTTTYSYDAVGNLVGAELPNGVTTSYEYDDLNRLTNIVHKDAADALLASFDYTLAADGRRELVTETRLEDGGGYSTTVIDYVYDELGRLTREDCDSTLADLDYTADYVYDLMGNRLQKVLDQGRDGSIDETTNYTYDDSDRLILETRGDVTVSYAYDDNGSLTEARTTQGGVEVGLTTRSYDVRGRLAAVDTDGDGTDDVEYEYDDAGHRVRETVDGQTTVFLLDEESPTGVSQVLEEKTVAGAVIASYVYGFAPIMQWRDGQFVFYAHDGLRSTRLLTDTDGAIVDRYNYDAYGQTLLHVGATVNPLLFAGEWLDPATGLYNLRARDYDATLGRFTQSDPLRGTGPGVLNQYIYVNGDPVNFVDPTGCFSLVGMVSAIGIISTIASIGLKTYSFVYTVTQLLDIRDYVMFVRRLANVGIIEVEVFYEMQRSAFYAATFLIGSAMQQFIDLAIEVLSCFKYGAVLSFFSVGGSSVDVEEKMEEDGTVSVTEEIGDATALSKVFHWHHVLPAAFLKRGRDFAQPLFKMRGSLHLGKGRGIHSIFAKTPALLDDGYPIKKLLPKTGRPAWKCIKEAGGKKKWLERMRMAYEWLETSSPRASQFSKLKHQGKTLTQHWDDMIGEIRLKDLVNYR